MSTQILGGEKMNNDIKAKAKEARVKQWEIAEKLGITEFTFSRRLRHELPDSEKSRIMSIIDELAKEKAV